jgi:hypothetical protein
MKKLDDGTYVVEAGDKVVFGMEEIPAHEDPNAWRQRYTPPVPPTVSRPAPQTSTGIRENIS